MFKTASIVELIFEAGIVIACGLAWAIAGFPRFMEVATIGGLGFACVGVFVAMTWKKK